CRSLRRGRRDRLVGPAERTVPALHAPRVEDRKPPTNGGDLPAPTAPRLRSLPGDRASRTRGRTEGEGRHAAISPEQSSLDLGPRTGDAAPSRLRRGRCRGGTLPSQAGPLAGVAEGARGRRIARADAGGSLRRQPAPNPACTGRAGDLLRGLEELRR